jgi:hypothetical protein
MSQPSRPRHSASLSLGVGSGATSGFRGDVVTTLRGRNQGAAVEINSQYRRGEKYERDVRVVDLFESHRTAPGRRTGQRIRPAIDVKIEFD